MQDKPHLLIVDDDHRILQLLELYLSQNGYWVTQADSGDQAFACLKVACYDLIILDAMMPGISGLEFLRTLRSNSYLLCQDLPVLMLTARAEVEDRLSGFKEGADDYMGKPFEPQELLLRIEAILRRYHHSPQNPTKFHFGTFTFDWGTHNLSRNYQPIVLSEGELKLLKIFLSHPNQTLSRPHIATLYGPYTQERTIDVQITRLRRKIESDPRTPQFLHTVRHKGYIFRPGY